MADAIHTQAPWKEKPVRDEPPYVWCDARVCLLRNEWGGPDDVYTIWKVREVRGNTAEISENSESIRSMRIAVAALDGREDARSLANTC